MSKGVTFLKLIIIITIMINSSIGLVYATRPLTHFATKFSATRQQHQDHVELGDHNDDELVAMGKKCEEEEECLKKRTLIAHLDYIYTQKIKP